MTKKTRRDLSRRDFLGLSAASAAAAAGVPLACSESGGGADGAAAGAAGSGGGTPNDPTPSGGSNGGGEAGAPSTGTNLVGLVRSSSVGDAVRDAIALTSGLAFIRSGDTVLLKVNLNSGDPFPHSTNPEVVRAVAELALDHGAGRVIVGDRSNPSYDTMDAMERSGITAAAQALGIDRMDLDGQALTRLTPDQATHWSGGFEMYALLFDEVDHVINLPACKHHSMANFTMALKAWMGIIPQNDRSTAHSDLGNRLPELHLGLRESFVVLDATRACLTGGPNPGGEVASPGIVAATADPVACDVTGLAILKHALAEAGISNGDIDDFTVWSQPQIERALALGLGITNRSQYQASARGIDEIDTLMGYIEV